MAEENPSSKKTPEELLSLLRKEAVELDNMELDFSDSPRLRNLLNEFEHFTPTPESEQSDTMFQKTYYKGVFYKPKHANSEEVNIKIALFNNKRTATKENNEKTMHTDSFSKFVGVLEALLAIHRIDQTISPQEAEERAETRKHAA